MLVNSDHLENWLDSIRHLLIFLILAPFWLSERGQMCYFQAFSWQCIRGMGRSLSCSSLSCDIPRNEKGKFWHMEIIQLPSGGYPWLLCSQPFLVFYTPRSTKLNGVYWYHLVRPSLRPSLRLWTESCPLCIFYNIHRIHFIFTHLIKQLQKVCRV